MNALANSFIGGAQKRRQPTFAFSWMPLWERTEAKPTWSQWLAATWRSAPWLLLLPTVTHLPWKILTVLRVSSRWARSRCASEAPSWFPDVSGRPRRHLVSCSQELAETTSDGKLLLISDDHLFIWSSLVCHYGLPATPDWGSWMIS